ncbi:MAG TPA: ribonuclease R [Bacteroidales bacterium]|nr:ribonuclease R [Bacteroidales bacterium]HSA42310.1 ribonuclease R [Bacteroidales bacterium]
MKKKAKVSSKTAKGSFSSQVLNLFVSNPFGGYNFRQVSGQLGISDKASRDLVKQILSALCASGEIIEAARGKYRRNPEKFSVASRGSTVEGIIDMKQTGKAYLVNSGLDEDVYIAPNNTNRSLNGDRVRVMLFPRRKGRKQEGQVLEVLERRKKQIVGVLHRIGKHAFLVPDDTSMPVDLMIEPEGLGGATHGDKVIAMITEWPEQSKNPFGQIMKVLGKPGENDVEMNAILAGFDFPLAFSKEAEKEASRIPDGISEDSLSGRRDFRDIFTITIDPPDAKDFDDAISLKMLDGGRWEVGVHIADVSHYVKPGGAIDREAFERGTSVYLVDRTFPMLPEKLSNMMCSLRPHEDKLCFSVVFEIDGAGRVLADWTGKTVIRSDRRYAYEEVQQMIEGGEGDYKEELLVLHRIASAIRDDRFRKGAINFRSREVKFRLDEKGRPVEAFIKEQKEANWLIEEFMLLANRSIAEKIGKRQGQAAPKTFVYRIHDTPNQEKLGNFIELVRKLGYTVKASSRKTLSDSLNRLFEQVAGKGEENLIETVAIRTMAKAVYSTKNIGHYGLAFPYYTHFTSPIRRYPDLMVHRLLERYLQGKSSVNQPDYEAYCKHCSDMEKNATDAERASVKYKQAEFMLDKIGKRFSGLISGVSKWGIFVELDINKGEGMVPLRSMEDDLYYLDEDNYKVIGYRHGKEYRLGDPVRVIVRHIDLPRKQMDFEFVNDDG